MSGPPCPPLTCLPHRHRRGEGGNRPCIELLRSQTRLTRDRATRRGDAAQTLMEQRPGAGRQAFVGDFLQTIRLGGLSSAVTEPADELWPMCGQFSVGTAQV